MGAQRQADLEADDQRATAGRLALEIMHEIRNPLETLGHLCYLAKQQSDDPAQVRTYMDMAEEQLHTLGQIANQTLSFAKLSHESAPVDLLQLAESALRIHQRTIEAKRIHLVRKQTSDLQATVQASRILQLLSNLIANALEAMPEGGKLTLCLKKTPTHVEVTIADNGSGIRQKHWTSSFNRSSPQKSRRAMASDFRFASGSWKIIAASWQSAAAFGRIVTDQCSGCVCPVKRDLTARMKHDRAG